jgi:hypothetical protein
MHLHGVICRAPELPKAGDDPAELPVPLDCVKLVQVSTEGPQVVLGLGPTVWRQLDVGRRRRPRSAPFLVPLAADVPVTIVAAGADVSYRSLAVSRCIESSPDPPRATSRPLPVLI